MKTIDEILKSLIAEDFFGMDADEELMKTNCRSLLKTYHPDINKDKRAVEAFLKVEEMWAYAEELLKKGDYGKKIVFKKKGKVQISTKKYVYNLIGDKKEGDFTDVFEGHTVEKGKEEKNVWIKIPRDVADNDLVLNEVKVQKELETFCKENNLEKTYHGRFPTLLDNCQLKVASTNRQIAVYEKCPDCFTLEDVMKEYPEGLDMRHVAWIWRRLLISIDLMHKAGFVHGAVLPSNFLVYPFTHGGTLFSFTSTVKDGEVAKVMSDKYEDYYPIEVVNGGKLHSGTDVYMAAVCMVKLLGGNIKPFKLQEKHEKEFTVKLKGLFRACLLDGYARLRNAFDIHEDLADILKTIYGPAKFIEFEMPKKI